MDHLDSIGLYGLSPSCNRDMMGLAQEWSDSLPHEADDN